MIIVSSLFLNEISDFSIEENPNKVTHTIRGSVTETTD